MFFSNNVVAQQERTNVLTFAAGFNYETSDIKDENYFGTAGFTINLGYKKILNNIVLINFNTGWIHGSQTKGRYGDSLTVNRLFAEVALEVNFLKFIAAENWDWFAPYAGAGVGIAGYNFAHLVRSPDLIQPTAEELVPWNAAFIVTAYVGARFKVSNKVSVFVQAGWRGPVDHKTSEMYGDKTSTETMLRANIDEPKLNTRSGDGGSAYIVVGVGAALFYPKTTEVTMYNQINIGETTRPQGAGKKDKSAKGSKSSKEEKGKKNKKDAEVEFY